MATNSPRHGYERKRSQLKTKTMGHVWTVPAVQEEADYQRSVRVRSCIRPLLSLGGLPLSRCSRYGRWP